MISLFTHFTPAVTILLWGAIGLVVGRFLVGYVDWFFGSLELHRQTDEQTSDEARSPEPRLLRSRRLLDLLPLFGSLWRPRDSGRLPAGQAMLLELGTAAAFAAYVAAMLLWDAQQIEMVIPSQRWYYGRIVFHLLLISLMLAATATDLVDYVIPDEIPAAGVLLAVAGAVASGDLQMVHLWLDWNQAGLIVDGQIQYGGYIPGWIQQHQHLHGLAWSAAGVAAGAGMVWVLRFVSSLLLGQEALGLGDVTLMAMVGGFIGWQPVCFVIALAPLCGLVAGFAVRLVSGRPFIAFGPYLCLSTFVVLCTWRWLWEPTRDIFGHPPSIALLAGVALGGLLVLLVLLRVYRAIPVERRRGGTMNDER